LRTVEAHGSVTPEGALLTMLRRTFVLVLASTALSSSAFAGALLPWGLPAGAGVVGINPYVFAYPNDDGTSGVNLYPILYGQYGISDDVDVIAGLSGYLGGNWGTGLDTVELMPRYFFSDTMGVCLHAILGAYSGGPIEFGPELHAAWSGDALDLGLNLSYLAYTDPAGFDAGTVSLLVAPERYLSDSFSIYLEGDVLYGITASAVEAQLVPGVSWSFAETHYFSLGAQVPVTSGGYDGNTKVAPGLWYYTSFGGSGDDEAPEAVEG
jgi:hypothetical protein